MTAPLETRIGSIRLKNPVICGSGEHVMTAAGIRAGIAAGASVVVAKSTSESEAARDQLDRTDYVLLDADFHPLKWDFAPPRGATLACRSGLIRTPFPDWLETVAALDREAADADAYVAMSLILAELSPAVDMARRVEDAGLRILEFNIGTPYGDEAGGAVSTERAADRVREYVGAVASAVDVPVVASGGCGHPEHIHQVLTQTGADAALAASIFHYGDYSIGQTKQHLHDLGVPVRHAVAAEP